MSNKPAQMEINIKLPTQKSTWQSYAAQVGMKTLSQVLAFTKKRLKN